jgi:hypothetical protein
MSTPVPIGLRDVEFLAEQAVQVGADRLVVGGQLGGQGGGRGRLDGQVWRAEQVAERGPLADEQLDVGVFGGRITGMQLFQREQLRVHRGQQAGVEGAEQPGPLRGLGGLRGLFAGCVGGVDAPGQLGGHGRGSQLVVGQRIAQAGGRAGGQDADGGHRDHRDREREAERHQRAGRGSSERPH